MFNNFYYRSSVLNKIFFLLLIFSLYNNYSFSQKFMHSVGGTASVLFGELKTANPTYKFKEPIGLFTYFPRYNFVEFENASISVGAPVGVGLVVLTDAYSNKVALAFAYDLSAVIDCNIGSKSYYENPKSFGGYLGTGFSYTYVGGSDKPGYTDYKGNSYGPLLRGGLRFFLSANREYGPALTTGLFYKKGLDANKLSTVGLNIFWDF